MIVYHGSDSNFKTLKISKKLVKHQSTLDNEGIGIYFSTNIKVASDYGKYIYVLDVNDNYFHDFRSINTCKNYISDIRSKIYKETCIDIYKYMYAGALDDLITRLHCGGLAVCEVGREVELILDSSDYFYTSLGNTTIQKIFNILNYLDKNCPKVYMFTYHIADIGVIKDVSSDVVIIKDKIRR